LNVIKPNLKEKILQKKISDFVAGYLIKHYFSETAQFNSKYWSYYSDLNLTCEFNTTTNAAESINKRLKVLCGSGFLPFKSAWQKIHNFKNYYLQEYQTKGRGDNVNARRRKTIDRETNIIDMVREYDDQYFLDQNNIHLNAHWACQLGMITN